MPHRRRSRIEALTRHLREDARRLSLLGATLTQLRRALSRLTREVLVCIAVLLGIWQLLADTVWRVLSSLWH